MKKLFPVIHHKDDQTTFENAKIAFNEGCAGIFLIEITNILSLQYILCVVNVVVMCFL